MMTIKFINLYLHEKCIEMRAFFHDWEFRKIDTE